MINNHSTFHGRYAAASRYEILAMIHLSHLADASGRVEKFRTIEFMRATGCSRREAFALMHSLSEKGYISLLGSDWKCCTDVLIRDNDFSVQTKMHYLNTNHPFFFEEYEAFSSLSVTAMRLMLFLMFNYSMGYGYHASYGSLMRSMGFIGKHAINKALKELEPLLSSDRRFYRIREDLKRGGRYGHIDLAPFNRAFEFSEGVDGQESYFKRHIRLFTQGEGIEIIGVRETAESLLKRLFGLLQTFADRSVPVSNLKNALYERIRLDGILNELTIHHLSQELSESYS